MILPVPVKETPSTSPAQELRIAMRLLSGKDCTRDASAAQVTLLRLSESRKGAPARDAEAILRAGKARDWFGDAVPQHFELERLAPSAQGKGLDDNRMRQLLLLVAGLTALMIAGVVAFSAQSDSAGNVPWASIGIVLLAVVGFAVYKLRNTSN